MKPSEKPKQGNPKYRERVYSLVRRIPPGRVMTYGQIAELLGGMRIRVGSDVWDSSVRNRLQRLANQL